MRIARRPQSMTKQTYENKLNMYGRHQWPAQFDEQFFLELQYVEMEEHILGAFLSLRYILFLKRTILFYSRSTTSRSGARRRQTRL